MKIWPSTSWMTIFEKNHEISWNRVVALFDLKITDPATNLPHFRWIPCAAAQCFRFTCFVERLAWRVIRCRGIFCGQWSGSFWQRLARWIVFSHTIGWVQQLYLFFADRYWFEDLFSETMSFGGGLGAEKARTNHPGSWRQHFGKFLEPTRGWVFSILMMF